MLICSLSNVIRYFLPVQSCNNAFRLFCVQRLIFHHWTEVL